MDELLQHCLRELAFDGDLGCNVSRLRDFVGDFYASHNSMQQSLDDSYHAFIWSLVAQQPSARVGVLPDGQNAEVYIPPQPRASKKNKNADAQKEDLAAAKLELIPDANCRTLEELIQTHGARLRIAVDPEACFVAITGSHAKPAKLTPMVYASLQLISRSREKGFSVLELGRTTGYDQKTCFYLVKQLVDLDLVVKLRRGGNSQNFCIHKYFFERSPTWKTIREEELRDQDDPGVVEHHPAEVVPGGTETGALHRLHFDSIDTRHLSSLTLIRQRLTKLLKHSLNETQPYANISVRIGFRPRSRTDRRFFITRLNELINEGTIEKFIITSANPDTTQNKQIFLRLASPNKVDNQAPVELGTNDDDEDMINNLVAEDAGNKTAMKSTMTLHKQIIDHIEESSTTGATLNELNDRLGSFDKRTLDLLISRMDRHPPPAHLADLSIIQVLETHGRERRYRFFTQGGYTKLIAREGFEQPPGFYSAEDVARAGGFIEVHESEFYETQANLEVFMKKWNGVRINKIRDSTQKRKNADAGEEDTVPKVSKKKWVNPILPDGTRKKGRPLKSSGGVGKRGQQKKRIDSYTTDQAPLTGGVVGSEEHAHLKRKRGDDGSEISEAEIIGDGIKDSPQEGPEPHPFQESSKRKRGRPPKKKSKRTNTRIAAPSSELGGGADLPHIDDSIDVPEFISTAAQSKKLLAERSTSNTMASSGPLASGAPLILQSPTGTNQASDHNSSLGFAPDIITPATNNIPSNPTALLDSLTALQGASPEVMAQPGFSDEVTKMIASLAAQVNETLTSSLPLNTGISGVENQSAQTLASSSRGSAGSTSVQLDIQFIPVIQHDVVLKPALGPEASLSEITEPASRDVTGDSLSVASASIPFTNQVDGSSGMNTNINSRGGSVRRISSRFENKTNLTAMRRENELVQLIEDSGGVVNTSTKEFLMAFANFIVATVKAGEVASAPVGSRMDRRTLNYSLDKLAASGRIKIITTNLPVTMGGYRSSRFAYLPSVPEEKLRKFIADHGCDGPMVTRRQEQAREFAEKEIELDPRSPIGLAHQWLYSNNSLEVYQERWHRNPHRAEELFEHSDDVIREALLLEKQTLSQLYGYMTGKVMRARMLHLQTIKFFENARTSSFVESTEPRIVKWAFFENDLSLGTFCACFASSVYREDLKNSLATSEGRSRPVRDISGEWKQLLLLGRARSRDRIFDLLDYLRSLKLVIPLRRITVENSPGTQSGDHELRRTVFEVMPSDWATKVPFVRPEFWQFSTSAPLYLFALQKDPAPYWKTVPTSSELDTIAFWEELKVLCLNKNQAESAQRNDGPLETVQISSQEPYSGERRVATALRRPTSWIAGYTLSWYQTQYLKRFINVLNGNTPLENNDPTMSRLQRISYVLSAPLEVVRDYFEAARRDAIREVAKQKRRNEQRIAENKEAEMKLLLVKKGQEAVKNRERAWEAMIEKARPGLVKGVAMARLRKLRQAYVRGNVIQDNQHWEKQILDAIKAAEKMRSDRNLFTPFSRTSREVAPRKTPKVDSTQLPSVAQDKSVGLLIDMQKDVTLETGETDVVEVSVRKRKRKSQALKEKGGGRVRRQRFQWTADYDELARDVLAIVGARCRSHHRLEWGAITQVFPSVPRNSFRARIATLKSQPGAEAYLQRLENCWHDLWVKNRGTVELPDSNPRNPTEFDLKGHLEYLRKYVDKNAIRVGISTHEEAISVALPSDLAMFESSWDLEERKPAHSNWDFLSNIAIGEDAREKIFLESAFILEYESTPEENNQPERIAFAESALKMVVATPNELYKSESASSLLKEIGENEVNIAKDNLLSRNVLSKLAKDHTKFVPGRTIRISELNQNALGGPFSKDFFVDASQLEESYASHEEEWQEWPLTSTDGDTAALLQHLSDHKVDFSVNTSRAQAVRPAVDGNSRKVDDEDLELILQVKLRDITTSHSDPLPYQNEEVEGLESSDAANHGSDIAGERACCKIYSSGVVNCLKCIEAACTQLDDWSDDDKFVANAILQHVDGQTVIGTRIEGLKRAFIGITNSLLMSIVHRLSTLRVPLIHLTGYTSSIVVSAKYIKAWAVAFAGEDGIAVRVFPRRWLDISGNRLSDVWEASVRALVGVIHLRPDISQAELRWRLRAVYDRQEVIELLNHLVWNGTLRCFNDKGLQLEKDIFIEALSEEEEKNVFWTVREEKHWYQVS